MFGRYDPVARFLHGSHDLLVKNGLIMGTLGARDFSKILSVSITGETDR